MRVLNLISPAQVRDLQRETGLPKASVSRLLQTLRAAGYVTQSSADRSYVPSTKARELSLAITHDEWIAEVAAPAMSRLSREILWPSDLATMEGCSMVIRHTTRPIAPVQMMPPITTNGLSVLNSDFGRAYLGFATDAQRQRILRALARSSSEVNTLLGNRELSSLVEAIRAKGYATRLTPYQFDRTSTIAIPIIVNSHVIAAMNVICFKDRIDPRELPSRFLAPLQLTAEAIANRLKFDGFVVTINSG